MSVEINYRCDTCRDNRPKEEMFAVYFNNTSKFNLLAHTHCSFADHKGVHVCQRCLEQYRAR